MAENEFEKRMQVKLEQFNVAPSPAVWQAVTDRVQKEKKRRFIFFWVLVGLFLGGAGTAGILLINANKNNSSSSKIISVPATNNENKPGVENNSNEPVINPVNPPASEVKNNATAVNEKAEIISDVKINNKSSYQTKDAEIYRETQKNKFATGTRLKPGEHTNVTKTTAVNNMPVKKDEVSNIAKREEAIINKEQDEVKQDSVFAINKASDQKQELTESKNNTVSPEVSASAPLKDETSKTKNWFIALSAGRSAIVNRVSLFGTRGAANFQSSPTQSPPNYRSFDPVPSFSLSAGLFYKQILSPRVSLNYGFNYQFLSTRMHAGTRIDSNLTIGAALSSGVFVNRYYRPSAFTGTPDYTTQYHFLGASTELSWKFIDKKKFTTSWNNGLTLNRLIYSNNLEYDPVSRVYYKSTDLMKKTQVFFQTSLEFPIGPKLSISPFGSFSLTSVFKGTSDSAYRYTNYGIQIRIPLNKK